MCLQRSAAPLDVIYILSSGHSGSTLLDLLLGSHSHIESLGEVKKYVDYIDSACARPNDKRHCTCGQIIDDCPYWKGIRSVLRDRIGTDRIDLESEPQREFERHNYEMFRTVLYQSGKSHICDSSKSFRRLYKMNSSEFFNTHIFHLVRDGRAVAYSYYRKGHSICRLSLKWQKMNLAYRLKLQHYPNYHVIRYEDLVSDPADVLTPLLESIGLHLEHDQLAFWQHEHHNLSGNRMRIRGDHAIQRDTRYLHEMSLADWMKTTTLASVALKSFGYPLRKG